jgi:predicted  nucleic acid-binding Zn-ribbon protein
MLTLSFKDRKCERCGKKYSRFTEQEMESYCVKCGKRVYYCDDCIKKGCPDCGGKLVNVWDYHASKGSGIMF